MIIVTRFCVAVLALVCSAALPAQINPRAAATTSVPRLVRVNGTHYPEPGPLSSRVESATLSIYASETAGSPLWQETQNVAVDAGGHYSVLLGSTRNEGLPVDLFASGEPRWLGVQFQQPGESEQPRVLLASVPYALKAADAETLGGQPLSAFVLASPVAGPGFASGAAPASNGFRDLLPRLSSGTPGYIGQFVNTTDLGNSVLYQNSGKIGLGTANPQDYFHVAFNDTTGGYTGYTVQNLGSSATSYSGMLFYDQNGATAQFQGFNNSTHEYRINNVAKTNGTYDGSINFMLGYASRFLVRSDGDLEIPGSIRKGGYLFLHNLGSHNTALGLTALADTRDDTGAGFTGSGNTAVGDSAAPSVTSGNSNTAVGYQALNRNQVGGGNTAIGVYALMSAGEFSPNNNNTAVGQFALSSNDGSNNIGIGYQAGLNSQGGSNNIFIGNTGSGVGAFDPSNTIAIGSGQNQYTFIYGIRDVTTGEPNAIPVMIDNSHQLGTMSSSRRVKEDIQDMGDSSANPLKLRPVTFRYKKAYADGSKPLDYGLVAEEVAEIFPGLAVRNKDGQIQTVQYQKLTPMLLNELQKQNSRIAKQDSEIKELKEKLGAMSVLESRLAALESLLLNKGAATAAAGQ